MAPQLIVTGDPGLLHADHLALTLACMTLTAIIGTICMAICIRRVSIRGWDIRHILMAVTALLLIGELANNGLVFHGLQVAGIVDLFPYYVTRSLCFLPSSISQSMLLFHRIQLLILVPSTRRKFLIVSTFAVISADIIAIVGMWDATMTVARIGTLEEWQWRWRFPIYGVAASAVFPLVNVAACSWSLRVAFLLSRGPSTDQGADIGVMSLDLAKFSATERAPRAVPIVPSSSRPMPPPSLNSSTTPLELAPRSDAPNNFSKQGVRWMASSAASLSLYPQLFLRPQPQRRMSPSEASITRSFWYLTICEMFMWFTFMGIIGSATPTLPLWTRNGIYTLIAMGGLAVETGFEGVYRFELTRAKSRKGMNQQSATTGTDRPVPANVVAASSRAAMGL